MKLRVLTGPRRDEEITLEPGDGLTIGRAAGCGFRLDDRKLSRQHCEIVRDGQEWVLRDGGSVNGTWVDGQRVEERVLTHGNTVTLGDTAFECVDVTDGAAALAIDAGGATVHQERSHSGGPEELPGPPPRRSRRRAVRRSGVGSAIGTFAALIAVVGLLAYLVSQTTTENPEKRSSRKSTVAKRTAVAKSGSRKTSAKTVGGEKTARQGEPDISREPGVDETPELSGGELRLRVLLEQTLPRHVEQHRYNRALSLIDYHVRIATDFDAKAERDKVHAAARAFLADTVSEMGRLGEENSGEEALELAFDRLRHLPSAEADDLTEVINAFETKSERLASEALGRDKFEIDSTVWVLRAIAALDFDAVRAAVAIAREADGAVAFDPARLDRLAHRAAAAQLAWRALSATLGSKSAGGSGVPREFHEGRPVVEFRRSGGVFVSTGVTRGRYRLGSVTDGLIDAEKVDEHRYLFDVFALSDDCLLRNVRGAKKPEPAVDALQIEGLGVLLLLREGPSRLESFLGARNVDEVIREGLKQLAGEHRDTWLLERRRRTRVARNYVGTDVKATPEDWIRLAARIAENALLWKGRPDYRRRSRDLLNGYRDARLEHLRRRPPRRAFHTSKLTLDGDALKIVYDFSTDEQLEDLRPVGTSSVIQRQGDDLLLRGECRFFEGNPFTGKVSVKVRLPARGYDASRPSIGIALWTFEGYSIRGADSMALTVSMKPRKASYADYFVFAYGYYAAPYDFGGEKLYQVHPVGVEDFLDLPADVVFLGQHGRPLHRFSGECLWARRRTKRTTGALTIQVEAGEGISSWTANRAPIFREAPAPFREFLETRERVGSVTLLTGDKGVRIRSVEIEGQLDPIWIQDRFQTAIEKELRRIFE